MGLNAIWKISSIRFIVIGMSIQSISKPDGAKLAYHYHKGAADLPCVMFCGGYRSDMNGTKALYFENACIARGQSFIRFDYGGHGQSDGAFQDGTIGAWANDALYILDHVVKDDTIIALGSSMGGWMAFLLAKHRPKRIHAIIGIAAAPDFTQDIYNSLSDQQKSDLHTKGFASVANDYSTEPYHYSKSFYDKSLNHFVLNGADIPDIPITLVQGGADKDVLPDTPDKIKTALPNHNIQVIMIEDGNHRLSRLQDLAMIDKVISDMP